MSVISDTIYCLGFCFYAAAQVHKYQSTDSLVEGQFDALFVIVSKIICITFGVQLSVQVLHSWVHLYKTGEWAAPDFFSSLHINVWMRV